MYSEQNFKEESRTIAGVIWEIANTARHFDEETFFSFIKHFCRPTEFQNDIPYLLVMVGDE